MPDGTSRCLAVLRELLLFGLTGLSAMFARLLVSKENYPAKYWIKRLAAAAIVSAIAGKALSGVFESEGMLYAAIGVFGAAADAVIDAAIERVQKFIRRFAT